jgi:hypothetical protein
MGATSSPQQQDNEPATSTANGPGSDVVGRKKSVQNLRRMLSKPWAWIAGFAIIAVVVILAAALSNIDPLQALVPAPALAPAAATPVGAHPRRPSRPASPSSFYALLSPHGFDLHWNLSGRKLAPLMTTPWTENSRDTGPPTKSPGRQRQSGNTAVMWQPDQKARFDEYAWLLKSDIAAANSSDV